MQTIRGKYNGATIDLLDESPFNDEAYVLVTFLDGSLETAAARERRMSQRDSIRPPHLYGEGLRKQMATQYRRHTVGSIMTRRLVNVPPSTKVASALHIMRLQGITSILVEPDSDGGECGIMTTRDLLKQIVIAERAPEDVTVGEIASKPLKTVNPDMSLRECSEMMMDLNLRRLVVEQDGKYVGIISDTDIFQIVEERGWGLLRADGEQSDAE